LRICAVLGVFGVFWWDFGVIFCILGILGIFALFLVILGWVLCLFSLWFCFGFALALLFGLCIYAFGLLCFDDLFYLLLAGFLFVCFVCHNSVAVTCLICVV